MRITLAKLEFKIQEQMINTTTIATNASNTIDDFCTEKEREYERKDEIKDQKLESEFKKLGELKEEITKMKDQIFKRQENTDSESTEQNSDSEGKKKRPRTGEWAFNCQPKGQKFYASYRTLHNHMYDEKKNPINAVWKGMLPPGNTVTDKEKKIVTITWERSQDDEVLFHRMRKLKG